MRSHLWRIGRVVTLAAVTLAPSLAVMPQALAFTAPSLSVPLYAHQALTHADGSQTCYLLPPAYLGMLSALPIPIAPMNCP